MEFFPEPHKLVGHSSRDLFFYFINFDKHYDKLHVAKELSEKYFQAAEEFMKTDRPEADFPTHFTHVPFSPENATRKVTENYRHLWKAKYEDWLAKGQPVKPEYDPAEIGGGLFVVCRLSFVFCFVFFWGGGRWVLGVGRWC